MMSPTQSQSGILWHTVTVTVQECSLDSDPSGHGPCQEVSDTPTWIRGAQTPPGELGGFRVKLSYSDSGAHT